MTSRFSDTWSPPEHVHLLLGEPERGDLSRVMQVLKQRAAVRVLTELRKQGDSPEHFWVPRFYDFNVWSDAKRIEKLIRWLGDWCPKRTSGSGAVFGLTLVENRGWWWSMRLGSCGYGPRRRKQLGPLVRVPHPFAKNAKGWGTHREGIGRLQNLSR
jgi:hypothetical protein